MCLNKLLFGGSFYSNLRVLRRFLNFSSVGFLGICIKAQLKCAGLCRCGAGQDRELLTIELQTKLMRRSVKISLG